MYPHLLILFSGSGVISKKELKLFYTAFLDAGKLDDIAVAELTNKSYEAMTSNGEVQLSFHMYKLSFLNFLLGKQPNGPGQFMFGIMEAEEDVPSLFPIDYTALQLSKEEVEVPLERKSSFPIDYSSLNSTLEEREPYSPKILHLKGKGNRKSIIV